MDDKHATLLSKELALKPAQVEAVVKLLEEGCSIPFIARYRKEATGSLDEVAVAAVQDRLEQLVELDKRRQAVLSSLEERGLLSEALRRAVLDAADKATLEDIYLPHRPKRRTRAMMAREKGLEPLAAALLAQRGDNPDKLAARFVDPAKGVEDVEQALAGARDILAERMGESPKVRQAMRGLFARRAVVNSRVAKGKEESGATYRDWFDWREPLSRIAGHRALALFRGERESALVLSIRPPEDEALTLLTRLVVKGRGPDSAQVTRALEDGYKRLLGPSLETEARAGLKAKADAQAIGVFAANLRELLLAAPLGQKRVLALDPGFRTGAKLAVLDAQGALVRHTTIHPTGSERQRAEAAEVLRRLCAEEKPEVAAVGNGTAGRETLAFVRLLDLGIEAVAVSEAGASVYSASETARREFPDLDLTVRGAVSIGRRLQDPLAELVKIDPKAIGVGQYQHDVDQPALRRALDEVVTSCVNAVGVDVNTASPELLAYVSGLGPALAKAVVAHRGERGPFSSRKELLGVPRLGPKAFEQAAGFLRVRGDNVLDRTGVHPERYALVARMARDLGVKVDALVNEESARDRLRLDSYVDDTVGLPTLTDILAELARPGRDPRAAFHVVRFDENVSDISHLKPGMRLTGVVTNVTRFGAFVDVGVHRDGLVHISQLSDSYVADPAQVVKVGDEVSVTVTEVDLARGRIGLSMRRDERCEKRPAPPR
ncbi:Tex family protein [Fundidesulfovibrio butyratiphilus]